MKKAGALFLCMILAVFCASPAMAGSRSFPAALRFEQKLSRKKDGQGRVISIWIPRTANETVNEKMFSLIQDMAKRGSDLVQPSRSSKYSNRGDFGSYITRVGDRWMSFLTIGRVTEDGVQTWLSFDARLYNMETGDRVWLDNIVDASAGGWELLAAEVYSQLSALFPGEDPDPAVLEAMCEPKALAKTGFTVSPGHISLIWSASALYPAHAPGLLRVEIYLPLLRKMLTKEALEEMNCEGYTTVALTYDDGPSRGTTDHLIDELQRYGASATFFLIGRYIANNQAAIRREYDAGFSVQSHTWSHAISLLGTKDMPPLKIHEEKEAMAKALSSLIGAAPTMMRSPGGKDYYFQQANIDLPLIHWSVVAGDAEQKNLENDTPVYQRVILVGDGDIVLLHDAYHLSSHAAATYLSRLEKRSVLFVTVNDLCALRGIALSPRTVLFDARK